MENNAIPTERLKAIYRTVLGATIGFTPFALFFLIRDQNFDFITVTLLWLLTCWVIFSEWWSVEDDISTLQKYYKKRRFLNFFLITFSILYLLTLVYLIVALITGLAKDTSLFLFVLVFACLSFLDIIISIFYWFKKLEKVDQLEYVLNGSFDVLLLGVYLGIAFGLLHQVDSLNLKAAILIGVYGLEFLAAWLIVPWAAEMVGSTSD